MVVSRYVQVYFVQKASLKEFIDVYGKGKAWTIGSLFRPDFKTLTLGELMNKAKLIDLKDYTDQNQK